MRIILCGGGTSGHVTPALAMMYIIKKRYKKADFLYVGRRGGKESAAVTQRGIPLKEIEVRGLKRRLSVKNATLPINLLKAVNECKKIIDGYKPDLIICTGGYVSLPMLISAKRKRICTVLHESNAYPGLVTRIASKSVDLLLLSSKEAKEHLPRGGNYAVVGTPTLNPLTHMTKAQAKRKLGIKPSQVYILSFGGSLGASYINEMAKEMFKRERDIEKIVHLHGCGRAEAQALSKKNPEFFGDTERQKMTGYIENMPLHLLACDLAITRSGAMTVAEISKSKAPAILIPSPYVTADHQRKNALALVKSGACIIIDEQAEPIESASQNAIALALDEARLTRMKEAYNKVKTEFDEKLFAELLKELLDKYSAQA